MNLKRFANLLLFVSKDDHILSLVTAARLVVGVLCQHKSVHTGFEDPPILLTCEQ